MAFGVLPGTKKRGKKGFKPKSKTVTTKKAVTALVKSVIAREDETKFRSEIVSDRVTHNGQISFSDLIKCLPSLKQDQGEGAIYERVGRKVSVRGCHFHIDVGMADVTRSNNIIVHMWILVNKAVSNLSFLDNGNTGLAGNLLMLGSSGLFQGYNGYAQDAMLPVNSSRYKVLHHKTFVLGKNTGTLQDSTTAGNQPGWTTLRRKFLFKLKAPKTLVYEQDNVTPRTVQYPSNYAPFCVIGYQHVSNSDPDYANQDITVTARANLWFDDA